MLLEKSCKSGAPGEIRTPDLMLRRHPLYPAELRARYMKIIHVERGVADQEQVSSAEE